MNPPDSQPQPQKKRSYQNSTENQRAMQQERNRQYRKRCKMAAESLQLEFDNLRQLHMITSTELQEKQAGLIAGLAREARLQQEVLELQREIMNLNEATRRRESNWQHRLQLLANQARGTQPLVSPAEQSNPEHQRTTASVVILHCLPLLILPPLPQRVCFVPCSLGQSSLSSSSAPPFALGAFATKKKKQKTRNQFMSTWPLITPFWEFTRIFARFLL